MKRLLSVLIALVFVMTSAVSAAASTEVRVFFDDKEVQSQVSAYIEGGRTLVPVRALGEALGFSVEWEPAERRVTLSKEGSTIVLWVDSNRVLVNGVEETIEVPAKITGGSTFVPVRFVAEKLGSVVLWDAKVNGAKVYSPKGFYQSAALRGALMPDQKASYDMEMVMEMTGEGVPDEERDTTATFHMDVHFYQGNGLMTITGVGPDKDEPLQMQMAIKEGKIYMQNPGTGEWLVLGEVDLAKGFDPTVAIQGMPNLAQLQQDVLNATSVTLGGTEELDGVKVVRLDIDMSGLDLQSLMIEATKALGEIDDEVNPQFDLKVDRLLLSTWIEPETQFVRKNTADVAYVFSVAGEGEGEKTTMRLDMKMVMSAQPTFEPITFPDFGAAGAALPELGVQ